MAQPLEPRLDVQYNYRYFLMLPRDGFYSHQISVVSYNMELTKQV